jgi:hypothetical protein
MHSNCVSMIFDTPKVPFTFPLTSSLVVQSSTKPKLKNLVLIFLLYIIYSLFSKVKHPFVAPKKRERKGERAVSIFFADLSDQPC